MCRCAGSSKPWRSWWRMERRGACCWKPNHWFADQKDSEQAALQDTSQVRNWLQLLTIKNTNLLNTCCRYGPDWAQWREINFYSPAEDEEEPTEKETIDLGLDANLKITSVTGNSHNDKGHTWMLAAHLSNGTEFGPHGEKQLHRGFSERPSPSSSPMVLSHLSGDTTYNAFIIRFHWRPQWGGVRALLWFVI